MGTRGDLIDRVVSVFGDDGTEFRTYAEGSLNNLLYYLWDCHDWEFKHKVGTFATVSTTESYDVSVANPSIRSSQDIEAMYDSTNGAWINKVDLAYIKKKYPKGDNSGKPIVYAPWGKNSIYLSYIPDGIYTINLLFLAVPILPTGDNDDLETVCGLPRQYQFLLEKLLRIDMAIYLDDNRANAWRQEFEQLDLVRARAADMQQVENNARIKFWEESIGQSDQPQLDVLRFNGNYY